MENKSLNVTLRLSQDSTTSWCALLLAMTGSLSEESDLKGQLALLGFQCVVTELGGKSSGEFQEKVTRAVIGACLHENLIHKVEYEVHALLHAAEEAKKSIMVNSASVTNIAVKVGIVRKDRWIAVAMYGDSSIHPVSTHDRCGLGTMHI